jgi:hypothetical protein
MPLDPEVRRVLDKAHRTRNSMEYEGTVELDKHLVTALLRAAEIVCAKVEALGPVRANKPGRK